jgi:hypothetical protein
MRRLGLIISFSAIIIGSLRAQQSVLQKTMADVLFHQLINAEVLKDYEDFVAKGTPELKAALSKTQFDASSDLLAPKLKSGFTLDALGELNQGGCQVYLYRLRFKNGGDDILATMSLKDGLVAGIYFK